MFQSQCRINSFLRICLTITAVSLLSSANLTTVSASEKVTKRNLKQMLASATTPNDHKAIADYYLAEASKARDKAGEHEQMAEFYRKAGEGIKKVPYAPGTIDHCERLVKSYRAAAEDLTALAAEHEAMATKVK